MKYPREVKVRGYRYTIDYVETEQEVDRALASSEYIGQVCAGNPGRVRIYAGQQPIGIFDSVIHEILHIITARNNVLRAAIRPEIGEEAFVDTLATELADLLVTNGWVTLPKSVKPTLKRVNQSGT